MRRKIYPLLVFSMVVVSAISYAALTSYRNQVLHAREDVLRDDLRKMRTLIDQYATDKGALPQSLDDLVRAGYLREIPRDPFTEQPDWIVVVGPDPNSSDGRQGMIDVRSASLNVSRAGTPYQDW